MLEPMTAARSLIVDPAASGYYHCTSRCVRRAFLCGSDPLTGRDCSHRKAWVEDRIRELAELFALNVYAFAVMSNHYHVVVHLDPAAARAWSADEVAQRWTRLFPIRINGAPDDEANAQRRASLLADPARLAVVRRRLGSLSWFMRCLNEPIARRANREDSCKGRFWEGRFHCQALLDETALLACMTYVDLNPIRAGLADDLPSSTHTSVAQRIASVDSSVRVERQPLRRVSGSVPEPEFALRLADYLDLVDWTGRQVHEGKRGVISRPVPPALAPLAIDETDWQREALCPATRAWRAVGTRQQVVARAQSLGQRWFKGYRSMRDGPRSRDGTA